MPEVELVLVSGCPNAEPARLQLRRALRQAGLVPRWREWRLDGAGVPEYARGYGSPTVLVNRRDVARGEPSDGSSCCRTYTSAGGSLTGVPSIELILDAIRSDIHNRADEPAYTPVPAERDAVCESWSDEALMAAYQQGDRRAFELLFGRYQDRLYGYFVRRFQDRELAADLVQRTFLRLHRAREQYDPERSFATWIFSIASNLGKDELKRRARRPGDVFWTAPEDARASAGTPEGMLLATERALRIEKALAILPDSQREVIVLHKLEGMSFPEVAEALGERVEAVKSRAFRGYRALRRILDPKGEGR